MKDVSISQEPVDISKAISAVMRKDCGAVVTFIGTIRDNYEGKPVRSIEVEAQDEMALKDLQAIIDRVKGKHAIGGAAVAHRTGKLYPGDVVVVIAVSAPHRAEAFSACREIIDSIKQTTPIWKQEFTDDGGRWVESEAK